MRINQQEARSTSCTAGYPLLLCLHFLRRAPIRGEVGAINGLIGPHSDVVLLLALEFFDLLLGRRIVRYADDLRALEVPLQAVLDLVAGSLRRLLFPLDGHGLFRLLDSRQAGTLRNDLKE